MSKKKTTKKERQTVPGDVATERCAKCATRTAAKQARECERYWSQEVRCTDCGTTETLSEVRMLRENVRIAFQAMGGKSVFTWRCPQCGVGLVTVDGVPPRLVRHLQSKQTLF